MTQRLPVDPPTHLTTFEVAKLLGMAVRSVQLMVNRNELEGWKTPGGHRRITRESVEKWLGMHPQHAKGSLPRQAQPPASMAVAHASSGQMKRPASGKPSVLLVEDSIHYQTLVKMLLQEAFPNVELHTANDGISGMAMFGALKPQILIVDLMLPGIDGATLIGALRTNPALQVAKLIVVTSLTRDEIQKYNYVLQGLPVIHKTDLVGQLPVELTKALQVEATLIRAA